MEQRFGRRHPVQVLVAVALVSGSSAGPATGGSSSPAPATPTRVLTGLPLPDRVVGGPPGRHRVRAGESLWTITERWLPGRPPPTVVDPAWRALYRRNRAVLGPDPDLVVPGTVLRLPLLPLHRSTTDRGGAR